MLVTSFNSVLVNREREFEFAGEKPVRDTLLARYKHAFEKDSVQLGDSYYQDDWDIKARVTELRYFWKQKYGKFTLEPSYRYYTQNKAEFFAQEFSQSQRFQTSDSDLGSFDGHSVGLLMSLWALNWFTSNLSN